MIQKMILITVLTITSAVASIDQVSPADTVVAMNEKAQQPVWNTSIEKKISGKSCKDGNCLSKDGKIYKFFSSLGKKVKKECKKM